MLARYFWLGAILSWLLKFYGALSTWVNSHLDPVIFLTSPVLLVVYLFPYLSLIEPYSIDHALHSTIQICRVKHNKWWFTTELQRQLFTGSGCKSSQLLSNLSITISITKSKITVLHGDTTKMTIYPSHHEGLIDQVPISKYTYFIRHITTPFTKHNW